MKDITTKELIPLIFTLNRMVRDQVAGHGRMDALSLVQLKILSIVQEKGAPTMKEIASALFITLPSTTSAIDRLVRDGQLNRIADENDRRVVRLEITDRGRSVYNKHYKDVSQRMDQILMQLSTQEMNDFAGILSKIINSYTQ